MTKKKNESEPTKQSNTMQVGSYIYWKHPSSALKAWVPADPQLPYLTDTKDSWQARHPQDREVHEAATPLAALRLWLEKQVSRSAQLLKDLEVPKPALPKRLKCLHITYRLDQRDSDTVNNYSYLPDDEGWPRLVHFASGWHTEQHNCIDDDAYNTALQALQEFWERDARAQNDSVKELQEELSLAVEEAKKSQEYAKALLSCKTLVELAK